MLHIHTVFSARDGLIKIPNLITKAKEYGLKWLSITDHATLGGVLDFYIACKENNIKPIIGCEFYLQNPIKLTNNPQERLHLILLAKTLTGWKNLMSLLKIASENFYYVNLLPFESLFNYSQDLICTTACILGLPAFHILNNNPQLGEDLLLKLKNIFKENLFIEIQPNSMEEQKKINLKLLHMANKHNIKCVLGIDAHYINIEDAEAHNILLGIKRNIPYSKLESKLPPDFYLYNYETLAQTFIKNNHNILAQNNIDASSVVKDLIANTEEIPNMVSDFSVIPEKHKLSVTYNINITEDFTNFVKKSKTQDKPINFNYLRYLTYQGYLSKKIDLKHNKNDYIKRINTELNDILSANIYDYLLVIYDIVNYCKQNNIPYSCGRGSACGSLVAFLLDLHTIDPIEYGLLWERFYNAGRQNSMPDFDFDVASSYRDKVIQYISSKYGKNKVAHITNYVYSKAKMTVKSVARFFEIPYSEINMAIKNIEDEDSENTNKDELDIILNSSDVKNMLTKYNNYTQISCAAHKIYDTINSISYHASGVVVTSEPLESIIPIVKCYDNNLDYAVEWDMKMLDKIGAIKIDVLGVKTIDVIANTINSVNDKNLTITSWKYMSPTDKKALDVFAKANTVGVFQFDYGTELKKILKKIKVSHFRDICIITALCRPGAKNFLDDYVNNTNKILLHNDLFDILKETNNVLVYQEQLMLISSKLASFTLKEADDLRKVVAKKQTDKVEVMYNKFIAGAVNNGIPKDIATQIWDTYFSSCSYLFNKSHAVAYSFVSYITAMLKAYYPINFLVACINVYYDNDNLIAYINELLKYKVKIQLPSIYNISFETKYDYINNVVTLGLNCVKSCGLKTYEVIKQILDTTTFKDNVELVKKLSKINEKNLLILTQIGVLDELTINNNRKQLYELMLKYKKLTKKASNNSLLFDLNPYSLAENIEDWPKEELLKVEQQVLGIQLSALSFKTIDYLYNITTTNMESLPNNYIGFMVAKFIDYDIKRIEKNNKPFNIIKYYVEHYFAKEKIYIHAPKQISYNLLKKNNIYLFKFKKIIYNNYQSYYTISLVDITEPINKDDISMLKEKISQIGG